MKHKRAPLFMSMLLAVVFTSCSKNISTSREKSPDVTITTAPLLGNRKVIDLPVLAPGASRTIVEGDGSFGIDVEGDLVRTASQLAAGTKEVLVRESASDGASVTDHLYLIEVTPAAWTLDAFPEMIAHSFTQENVDAGPVSSIDSVGVVSMVKDAQATASPGQEPVKLSEGQGIEFSSDATQYLSFERDLDAVAFYRWSLVIFRVDPDSGSDNVASLLRVNDGPQVNGRSGNWTPRIDYDKSNNSIQVYYRGTHKHELTTPANVVSTDGSWNVVLTYRRHGHLFLRVNGQAYDQSPPHVSFSTEQTEDTIESRIGDKRASTPTWALDGLWIGQSELSEAVVKKMEAWALGRAAQLPGGVAATATFSPVIDDEDFPQRYTFDYERFADWKVVNDKSRRWAYQGQPVAEVQPDRSDWVRVFVDDFRVPAEVSKKSINGTSVGDSTYDFGAGKQIWYSPGTNSAVGGKAISKNGSDRPFPEVVVLDPEAQNLTMRLYAAEPAKNGRPTQWRNSQFSSVNQAGVGYTWAGPKGFRVRAKFKNVGPGVFPCPMWFYNVESLFWRTGERIEFDIIELDDDWDNYGGTHVHHGRFKGLFGHSEYDTMKKKNTPEEIHSLKMAAGKNICGINAFDGNFHTWEVWIEADTTYINVDGVEVARVDTIPEYLERLYMYLDTSLKGREGMDESLSYDMVIDSVEAFQPPSEINATPDAPFTGRPTLTGNATAGSVVTCTSKLEGVEDVWYFWHVDGYPRGFGKSNTYTLLPEDEGAEIRCKVKAVGAKDQPEAWTAPLAMP
ncbi:hypothetical protein P3T73_08515 [Kiritimatiellota bacterium B12222]|nr:hypothetical protein P3T73_08515 [Kiritimatiellota bacterium B12222]